jgi:hypothetical protein
LNVIAGPVPAISIGKRYPILIEMTGTSPAMTTRRVNLSEKLSGAHPVEHFRVKWNPAFR